MWGTCHEEESGYMLQRLHYYTPQNDRMALVYADNYFFEHPRRKGSHGDGIRYSRRNSVWRSHQGPHESIKSDSIPHLKPHKEKHDEGADYKVSTMGQVMMPYASNVDM
jgi:hypothetical protein